ncbi:transmembrane and coiled-coil [Branchiostoma belcheri]|nr:transmembrane and coiled-coil [Branchiostoma belcheri]
MPLGRKICVRGVETVGLFPGGPSGAGNASLSAAPAHVSAQARSSPIPEVLIPPAVRLSRRSSSPVPRSSSPANRSGLRGLLPWRRENRPRSGSDPNSRDLMLRPASPHPDTTTVAKPRARSRSRSPAARIIQQQRGRQTDMHRGESHSVAALPRSRSPAVHDHGSTAGAELLARPRAVSTTSSLSDEPLVLPEAEGSERLATAEYSTATMSSQGSQGADSLPGDDIDGATSTDPTRYHRKKPEHVSEYLKLAANADRQQAARIKSVFEKKNQKSATNIQQLQRKLENYQRRLKEAQENGVVAHRQPKEVLRDMGQGLRAVVNKPKEFAHLIKNKFGSADNISSMKDSLDEREDLSRQFLTPSNISAISSGSEDECSSMTSGSGGHMALHSPEIQPGPSSQSIPAQVLQPILEELQDMRNSQTLFQNTMAELKELQEMRNSQALFQNTMAELKELQEMRNSQALFQNTMAELKELQEMRNSQALFQNTMAELKELQEMRNSQALFQNTMAELKNQMQEEYSFLTTALQEERYRYERLEEQLNDLTELHQNEMSNLKQELASMEEKVAYQSDERARDIQEALESCQTRISKMELAQQQQQLVSMEGLDSANARALISKLINVLLAVIAVILVLVSTLAGMVTPMLKTRSRVASSLLALLVTVLLWRNWGYVVDAYHHFLEHYAVMVTLR